MEEADRSLEEVGSLLAVVGSLVVVGSLAVVGSQVVEDRPVELEEDKRQVGRVEVCQTSWIPWRLRTNKFPCS